MAFSGRPPLRSRVVQLEAISTHQTFHDLQVMGQLVLTIFDRASRKVSLVSDHAGWLRRLSVSRKLTARHVNVLCRVEVCQDFAGFARAKGLIRRLSPGTRFPRGSPNHMTSIVGEAGDRVTFQDPEKMSVILGGRLRRRHATNHAIFPYLVCVNNQEHLLSRPSPKIGLKARSARSRN